MGKAFHGEPSAPLMGVGRQAGAQRNAKNAAAPDYFHNHLALSARGIGVRKNGFE
jgi:hypothetical protein